MPVSDWIDVLAERTPDVDAATLRRCEIAVMARIADWLVYVVRPEAYDAQPFLRWDDGEYLYRDMPAWALPLTLAGFAMSIVAMGFVHAWVYNSTGSVALNVLLHGWANVTNAVAVSVMASPLVPLATAGVTWLFVAWLLRRYGGATLRALG